MTENSYFNHQPIPRFTVADASRLNSIFDAIEAGFGKLPSVEEMNQGSRNFSIATGPANNYSVTVNFPITGYVAGLQVRVLIMIANTGASALNVNSIGAVTIKRADNATLLAGDLRANSLNDFTFDGTAFRLTSFHGASESITAANASTSTSAAAAAAASQATATTAASAAAASATTAASNASTAMAALSSARFGLRNLLENNLFWMNQRTPAVFSGNTGAPAGVFIRDRWRANSNTAWSISGATLTVTSGTVYQIVSGRNLPFNGRYTLSWIGSAQGSIQPTIAQNPIITVESGGGTDLAGFQSCVIAFWGGTVYLPQLEFGYAKTTPELRPVDLERLICHQYYRKSYFDDYAPGAISDLGAVRILAINTINFYSPNIFFGSVMRGFPATTIYSPRSGASGQCFKESPVGDTPIGIWSSALDQMYVYGSTSALSPGNAHLMQWTADAEL